MTNAHTNSQMSIPVAELINVDIPNQEDKTVNALKSVTWRIMPGDFWVVVGRAGAGKSELLSTIAGLLQPTAGDQFLFGKKVDALRGDRLIEGRMKTGMVFEDTARLFHSLSIYQNIALPFCYHSNCSINDAYPRTQKLLETLNLEPLANRTPTNLPRAVRFRIGLARALILRPELLLLDNPMSGFGPNQINWCRDFLTRLSHGETGLFDYKMTIVAAADDVAPLVQSGRKYAVLKNATLNVLEDPVKLEELNHFPNTSEFQAMLTTIL
ncbi:MAG: ATP-binding cassette domain-containing protein [Verrucomicrobia bacterium]|nr:ATP-binding cassette domain-containing protein [Verrucomicrobiota bacterium]MCF7707566.1 ATP-binding cassette domain-containing protein [Verrucomicrobiota bacterium]